MSCLINFQHPDFEGGSPWPNDIALIEIAESVDLSDEYVDVVSISSHGVDYPFSGCVISGWGHETGIDTMIQMAANS